jgi:Spy/CpxP family protein refolding chaperone
VNTDPVTLRQAITELQAQLLAARAGLPAVDRSRHQHLHLHGLTPEQAAAIFTELQERQHPGGWQDGGSP